MRVASARDVGALVRDRRVELGLTQAEAAQAAGMGREWLVAVEAGHPRAQLASVLHVLTSLGLVLDAQLAPGSTGRPDAGSGHDPAPARHGPEMADTPANVTGRASRLDRHLARLAKDAR
ncbi:MAG: helix-turn-helix transcriptional regulator [Actinobacteria bacterium]|nr:helix-turn-helix transcriptional regulator [Actinomycetota bacterium]MBI3686895.1 helix-turn-helix transcriptional regulator [Actinomycetota bacterium]